MATSIHLQHFKIYTVEGEQEGEEKEDAALWRNKKDRKEVVSDRSQNSRAVPAPRSRSVWRVRCYGKAST